MLDLGDEPAAERLAQLVRADLVLADQLAVVGVDEVRARVEDLHALEPDVLEAGLAQLGVELRQPQRATSAVRRSRVTSCGATPTCAVTRAICSALASARRSIWPSSTRRQHDAEADDQHQREQAELAEQRQAETAVAHPTVDRRLTGGTEVRRTLEEMPEGDTIHYAARRIRPVLEGHVPDELATPHPRFARDRWPERLAGRAVRSVDAHGKHLFLRFEGGLTIHSHLRMTGSWRVFAPGQRWTRSPRAAWLVLRRGGAEVVQFNGPVLELMTESRTRFDQRIAGLGPDILAPEFDYERYLRRLREDDPTRPIGDAVLAAAHGRGDREPVEGRGLLRGRDRPLAADRQGQRRRGGRDRRRRPPAHAAVGARRQPDAPPARLRPRRAARARAAAAPR